MSWEEKKAALKERNRLVLELADEVRLEIAKTGLPINEKIIDMQERIKVCESVIRK